MTTAPKHARRCPRIEGSRAAVVVVDMQRCFEDTARTVEANVCRVARAAAAAGAPAIVFTQHGHAAPGGVLWDWWGGCETRGSAGWRLVDGVERLRRETDAAVAVTVQKESYSAFVGINLEETLRQRGVDTVVVTGVFSECCCESTARDAFNRGFRLVFVRDATAAACEELHESVLGVLAYSCAYVPTAAELCSCLLSSQKP